MKERIEKNYFFIYALIGLSTMYTLLAGLFGQHLWNLDIYLDQSYLGFSILSGVLTVIFTAVLFDQKTKLKESAWKSILISSPLIYLSGILTACTLNLLINQTLSEPQIDLGYGAWRTWIDPMLLFSAYGIPCSIIIGSCYRLAIKITNRCCLSYA